MSREVPDAIRERFEAFNRGDYEAWISVMAEDVEFHDLAETPDTGVFRGHAGVRAWIAKLQQAWDDGFRMEPKGFIGGEEVGVLEVLTTGTGAGSGVPTTLTMYMAWRLRDGKVVWSQGFLDRQSALEAVGLRE